MRGGAQPRRGNLPGLPPEKHFSAWSRPGKEGQKVPKLPCVYIMSNKNHTVLYTGVTSDLPKRVGQHRQKLSKGFTSKYNCDTLVYYEFFAEMEEAIKREKQIKAGSRKKKEELINAMNSAWQDLSEALE